MTSGYTGGIEEPRIQELRDNISKKQMQISQAKRDYQELLDNPPKNRPIYASSPKGNTYDHQAAPSNEQLLKLESEIGDIKKMLSAQMSSPRRDSNLLDSASNVSASMNELEGQSDEEVKKYIAQQKQIIKKTQEKLEQSKKQYKADKQKYLSEEFKNANPSEYVKQKQILDDVKKQIEERIDKLNQRVEKIKTMEKRVK